jgi:diguanylate cyclase (GGDEF)-like protein/PAS domain S-box-containing protein
MTEGRAETALREQTKRLNRIIETQRAVAAADLDMELVMELMCERTQELTGAEGASILIADGDYYVPRAATGFLRGIALPVPVEGSLTAWVREHDRSAVCDDTATDPRVHPLARQVGIASMVCVPLRNGEEMVGVLSVASRKRRSFSEEHVNTLALLSVVLSSALSHASEFEAKHAEVEALARFRIMFERAPIGIVRVDERGRTLAANPAMEKMLGYTSDELAAMSFVEYTHPDDVERNLELFRELLAGRLDYYQFEKRSYRKDGELIWFQVTASLERDAEGRPKAAVSMLEDITARKLAEEALRREAERNEHQALHDALTGLPNRTLFRDRIQQAILAAKRQGGQLAVLMMDLDRFKEVNDSLGHECGDALLNELGSRLVATLRTTDTAARLGGDEFGVLVPTLADQADVVEVIRRIRDSFDEPIVLQDLPVRMEGSIGVALFPSDGEDVSTLLRHADMAMYTAKRNHSLYEFYDHESGGYDPARLRLAGDLRRALEERESLRGTAPR